MNHEGDELHFAIYIDTSGSMRQPVNVVLNNQAPQGLSRFLSLSRGTRMKRYEVAQQMWNNISPQLAMKPCVVRTINAIGASTELLELHQHSMGALANLRIPEPAGGTYLWEFLVKQGQELIQHSSNWMFVLISDGLDLDSPEPYEGIDGFRQTVADLREMGIDAEFHIIGLGLPDDACEVFRQVSGVSGGMFYNFGPTRSDQPVLEDVMESISDAIQEAIDPALRARSRRRRQLEYLEARSEGDLDLSNSSSIVSAVDSDPDQVYERIGIQDLNPVEMTTWETSFLRIGGHAFPRTSRNDTWSTTISQTVDHRDRDQVRSTWTMDANTLQQIASGAVDKLFNFINDVRTSHMPASQRTVIVRGLAVKQQTLDMLQGTGAELILLPADLPPAPLGISATALWLLTGEQVPDQMGWSLAPIGMGKPSRGGVLIDLYHEVEAARYVSALNLNDLSYLSVLPNVPNDHLRYFKESSWTQLVSSHPEVVPAISIQFRALVKYLVTSLSPQTKVLVLRPSEHLLPIFTAEPELQIEFMNRTEDFLRHIAQSNPELSVLKFHYWPTIMD